MKRLIYVAGVNRKHLASAAATIPAWLLSATLLRRYPGWIEQYMTPDRAVRWDPGTFSEDAMSYKGYRDFIHLHAKPWHDYLQYDEIGDAEASTWYLQDMRKRGMDPIPILQGNSIEMLQKEPRLAIGGLVMMDDLERRNYLDEIFYNHKPKGIVHLLGMRKAEWFSPYLAAEGDNTSWIPRSEWNRKKSIDEWLLEYGEQWVPYKPREFVQTKLFA
ncbi:hypothetical protein [Paenibacillus glycanilyticus]|uniref:hypothetical protein n=1 Tax=Paenibacillus glycanilyticus TaxID=126569 RepID=UPI00190FEAB6|nr:hypothetical protein [Paenibacillus glycanilyticus]